MADNKDPNTAQDPSRRKFLKNTGVATGGVVGGALLGGLIGVNWDDMEQKTQTQPDKKKDVKHAKMFFTNEKDFQILSEATERIFPEDDNGPGAIELGVPYFIDRQLAGAYGYNTQEYMQGPFHQGTSFQGYQTRLKRNEIFTQGIKMLDQKSQQDYDSSFTDLEADKKDEILEKFENDKVKMRGVKSLEFFSILRDATLAGAYSDPLYSGNVDMEGWKMKEYPGHVASYKDRMEEDSFIDIDPTPL